MSKKVLNSPRVSKNGPQYSDTLLKGAECLWLGFHTNASEYSTIPITHHLFQEKALKGHIGIVRQAGMHGAEVEFSTTEGTTAKLNLSVEELLPMTAQEVSELRESISNIQGETTVSTQTKAKAKTQKVTTKDSRTGTYRCIERGCSFSSSSPQGLGTHRVKSHNLQSRSQKRSGGGRKVVLSSGSRKETKPISSTAKKTVSTGSTATTTLNTRDGWKAKHDAMAKRYNRLSSKYESLIKTLKQLSQTTA